MKVRFLTAAFLTGALLAAVPAFSVSADETAETFKVGETWTVDGEETVYSAKFTTTVQGVNLAEKVVLVQMSADHMELDRAEYLPDQMPESVTPAADAAYIIVEEYADGEVTRTLCQPGGDPIRVFCQEDQLYCLPRFTEILWEN